MTWEDRNEAAIAEARTSATHRNWYVVRIDSSQIGKALTILPQIMDDVIAFAPVEQRTRRAGRGLRSSITKAQPVMSGYVIVGFERAPRWHQLFQLPWVYNVISRDGRPAIIPHGSMQSCFRIHQSSVASLPGAKSLRVGDTIRVTEGGWRGHEAKLIDISGADCEFVVQLFGRDVKWRQPINQVEAA